MLAYSPASETVQTAPPTPGASVTGVDASLTGTGVATLRAGTLSTRTIVTKATEPTLEARHARLASIRDEVHLTAMTSDLIVIEAPAYGQTTGSHHDRSGAWWLIVSALLESGASVLEVTPQVVKKYATGKGNASKDMVLAAVVRRYLDVEVQTNDEADALVLAAIGARLLGQPVEASLPALNLSALDKVRWVR